MTTRQEIEEHQQNIKDAISELWGLIRNDQYYTDVACLLQSANKAIDDYLDKRPLKRRISAQAEYDIKKVLEATDIVNSGDSDFKYLRQTIECHLSKYVD